LQILYPVASSLRHLTVSWSGSIRSPSYKNQDKIFRAISSPNFAGFPHLEEVAFTGHTFTATITGKELLILLFKAPKLKRMHIDVDVS